MSPIAETTRGYVTGVIGGSLTDYEDPYSGRTDHDRATILIDLRGEPREPVWVRPVVRSLQQIMSRPAGWDSYGGRTAALPSIEAALRFLASNLRDDSPAPSVVPLGDGGLQLEWHQNGLDVEATFSGSSDFEFYAHEVASGEEVELDPWHPTATTILRRLHD